MSAKTSDRMVRIKFAATRIERIAGRDHRVICGVLTPDYFDTVMVPPYQREAMEHHKLIELMAALDPEAGTGVPDDLLLCLSSDEYTSVGAGEFVIPTSGISLLDGHQRMNGAWRRLSLGQAVIPFGVKIILGTTLEEEVQLFYQVNRLQTKVRTDVLLRNSADNAAIVALRELVERSELMPDVQWGQMKKPEHQITAHMLYEVAIVLHGRGMRGSIEDILDGLTTTSQSLGTGQMVLNVETFFVVLNRCFGGEDSDKARYMYRADVLRALAKLFWSHEDFWDSKNPHKLLVRAPEIKKLRTMRARILEEELRQSGASGALFRTFRRIIESGRRTGLTQRQGLRD